MQVNQSINTYTAALFQGARTSETSTQQNVSPGPASVFSSGVNSGPTGVYTDPHVALIAPATLSQKTQDILDTIQSLIANERKAVSDTVREMVTVDLELEPEEALPENFNIFDLSGSQYRGLSRETKDAGWFELKFAIVSGLASMDAEKLSGMRSIALGEQYVGMTEEELVDSQINTMVDMQISMIKQTFEMARSQEMQRYATDVQIPTNLGEPLSEEGYADMRDDLLAKRRDEFQRGELRIQAEFYASSHALNYGKAYAKLDTGGTGVTITEENGVVYDNDWALSDRKKQMFSRMFEDITIVDGKPTIGPDDLNLQTQMGMDFLEKHGEIGLEYLKDSRA